MSSKPKAWHVDMYARTRHRRRPTKYFKHVGVIQTMPTQKEAIQFATTSQATGTLLVVRKAYDRAPKVLVIIDLN